MLAGNLRYTHTHSTSISVRKVFSLFLEHGPKDITLDTCSAPLHCLWFPLFCWVHTYDLQQYVPAERSNRQQQYVTSPGTGSYHART